MTIFILEQYIEDKLTKYWLFEDYEKLSEFLLFCAKHDSKNQIKTRYKIELSYPNDRE